jgi:peptide deformylase
MIYNLVDCNSDILRTKLDVFNFDDPPIDPVELTNNLIETMIHNKGMGLAANQCGLPYRVFVLWSQSTLACFNPKIIDETTEKISLEEGCLSFPNLFLPIKRPKSIKVRFQDAFGEFHTEKYTGMTARAFLHELDHLNGVDYTSRANRIHLERARRKQKALIRFNKKEKLYEQA